MECTLAVEPKANVVDLFDWMQWVTAPAAGLVYYAISRRVGDVFPFSKYAMYASTAMRSEGGVPLFLADGEEARIDDYVDFAGVDPEAIYPPGIPCSLEWQVREWQRWLRGHLSEVEGVEGPVQVAVGFRMLHVDEAGKLTESVRITQRGTAWPKRGER